MTELPDLNELAARVHKANEKWWIDLYTGRKVVRNMGEMLMLVVSELSEALEGDRKGLMDDKLPHRKMAEVELADAYIRLLDVAAGTGFNVSRLRGQYSFVANFGENLLELVGTIMLAYNRYKRDNPTIDAFISQSLTQIEQLSAFYGFDLMGAFEEKMEFNRMRADHKIDNRKAEGGKKY